MRGQDGGESLRASGAVAPELGLGVVQAERKSRRLTGMRTERTKSPKFSWQARGGLQK